MIGGVTCLGGLPGLLGKVTLSAGAAFCHVNDSRWGNPPSRGRVHVIFASAPKHAKFEPEQYGRSKVTVKSHSTEMLQREQIMRGKRTLAAKMRRSLAIFSVYMPSLHATTSSNFTLGPRGCKFACKRGPYFDHGYAGYLTYLGSPTSM